VIEEPGVHTQPVGRNDRPGRWAPDQIDRIRCTVGSDDRYGLACCEDGREPLGLGGRRGGDQAHVGAKGGAHVDEEGEREVGVEVPFMALIEHNGGYTGQVGIVLQPLDEQPGSDDLDPRSRPNAPLPAYRIADRGADLLADQRGHPARRGSCGDPSRLGDNNPAAQAPGEGKWQQGGLARAGRRDEHRRAAPINLVEQRGQDRPNRKGRQTQQIRRDLRVRVGAHPPSLPYRAAAAYQHDQVSHRQAGAIGLPLPAVIAGTPSVEVRALAPARYALRDARAHHRVAAWPAGHLSLRFLTRYLEAAGRRGPPTRP
jgi:hypothetical protein